MTELAIYSGLVLIVVALIVKAVGATRYRNALRGAVLI